MGGRGVSDEEAKEHDAKLPTFASLRGTLKESSSLKVATSNEEEYNILLDALMRADEHLKSLEPQWLPAGQLPDAEGWWLWASNGNPVTVVEIGMHNGKPIDQHDGDFMERYKQDRFAPMPKYEVPTN